MSFSEPFGSSLSGAGPLPWTRGDPVDPEVERDFGQAAVNERLASEALFVIAGAGAASIHHHCVALENLSAGRAFGHGWPVVEDFVLTNELSTSELLDAAMAALIASIEASKRRAAADPAAAASPSAAATVPARPPSLPSAGLLPATSTPAAGTHYQPAIDVSALAPQAGGLPPAFPAYAGRFRTSAEAKAYRRLVRVAPKGGAPDVERVKKLGREYWVCRLYEAMVNIDDIQDGDKSVHRERIEKAKDFTATDLEACAHKIFDAAIAVHEVGWTHPKVYHKRVVRGKLADKATKSLEMRLFRLCQALSTNKATVDDAMRGGIPLALLVDNPWSRSYTKSSNNAGNKKRGERLQIVKQLEEEEEEAARQQEEHQEEQEDDDEEDVSEQIDETERDASQQLGENE